MFKLFRNKKQKGQGMVEYALVLVLVAVVVIAALTVMGPQVKNVFGTVNGSLAGGGGGAAVAAGPTATTVPSVTNTNVVIVCPPSGQMSVYRNGAFVNYNNCAPNISYNWPCIAWGGVTGDINEWRERNTGAQVAICING